MTPQPKRQVWFLTGSQHLYGEQTLLEVARHSRLMVDGLNRTKKLPVEIVAKPVLTRPESITELCHEANAARDCVGLIAWMHTFSPAKMWIAGLQALTKPVAHLHTQFNQKLPWATIDMDFMNLNQSAHGDREFGHLAMRVGLRRKVIAGYWQDPTVHARLDAWARAALGWHESKRLKVARFGDNMRDVAVTEGDKVEAQMQLGYSVSGYGVGDLARATEQVSEKEIDRLVAVYDDSYVVSPPLKPKGQRRQALRDAAKIELGLRAFLSDGGFDAFTDTFQDLHGLTQLPGVAVQRLMADGFGFGAEGDWKTAALVRTVKVMAGGLPGGSSFMEDYTYDFGSASRVLGAHMLEICPSISSTKPSLEIHPLSIGGKADPVRLVFTAKPSSALNVSLVQVGSRFRMIANEVREVAQRQRSPKLPVARAVWEPLPNLQTAAAAWIYAGGSHHTVLSQSLSMEHFEDFAEMAGLELLAIDARTELRQFRNEIRWNEAAYRLGCK